LRANELEEQRAEITSNKLSQIEDFSQPLIMEENLVRDHLVEESRQKVDFQSAYKERCKLNKYYNQRKWKEGAQAGNQALDWGYRSFNTFRETSLCYSHLGEYEKVASVMRDCLHGDWSTVGLKNLYRTIFELEKVINEDQVDWLKCISTANQLVDEVLSLSMPSKEVCEKVKSISGAIKESLFYYEKGAIKKTISEIQHVVIRNQPFKGDYQFAIYAFESALDFSSAQELRDELQSKLKW